MTCELGCPKRAIYKGEERILVCSDCYPRIEEASSEEARGVIQRLSDALEAADQRAAQAEAELKDAYRTDIPSLKEQRDELAAVVEKAEDYVTRHYFDTQMGTNVLTMLVGDDPADALRVVKAEAWDEGAGDMAEHIDNGAWWEIQNPYQEEQS